MIGTLEDINPDMPPFTGTDAGAHALAVYLSNPGIQESNQQEESSS